MCTFSLVAKTQDLSLSDLHFQITIPFLKDFDPLPCSVMKHYLINEAYGTPGEGDCRVAKEQGTPGAGHWQLYTLQEELCSSTDFGSRYRIFTDHIYILLPIVHGPNPEMCTFVAPPWGLWFDDTKWSLGHLR